jgi:hypothetical protein
MATSTISLVGGKDAQAAQPLPLKARRFPLAESCEVHFEQFSKTPVGWNFACYGQRKIIIVIISTEKKDQTDATSKTL